ncbi:MAG: ABC transporter permease, partial [Candidatus Acidiferrales bacterium]
MKKSVNQLIFAVAALALWEGLALAKFWPPYLFPTPQGVALSLWDGFRDHTLWIGIGVSFRRVVFGYLISVVLGGLLGIALASNQFLEDTTGRVILSLQSLPSACWVPLALLW